MSEAKHTPGPWRAKDQGEGPRGRSLGICISGANGLPLFFLPRGTEKNDANARLIAAAPDLLEALRAIRDSASEITLELDYDDAVELRDWIKMAPCGMFGTDLPAVLGNAIQDEDERRCERSQEMESGADDSAYRRDLQDAGRGRLLR